MRHGTWVVTSKGPKKILDWDAMFETPRWRKAREVKTLLGARQKYLSIISL